MKILSVYQAHTKQADGTLPHCDVISEGVREDWCDLFEAAPALLEACKAALAGYDALIIESPERDDDRFLGYVLIADKLRAAIALARQ